MNKLFTVYFSWPDLNAPPNWQFLGYISNSKPSAIFKISTLKKNHEFENSNVGIFGIGKISHVAQIGVSVEPLAVIEQQAATLVTTTTNNSIEFAEKMLTNFMNYVSSFLVTHTQVVLNPTQNFVPLSTVQGWYETFQRRLQQNPKFWKNMWLGVICKTELFRFYTDTECIYLCTYGSAYKVHIYIHSLPMTANGKHNCCE